MDELQMIRNTRAGDEILARSQGLFHAMIQSMIHCLKAQIQTSYQLLVM